MNWCSQALSLFTIHWPKPILELCGWLRSIFFLSLPLFGEHEEAISKGNSTPRVSRLMIFFSAIECGVNGELCVGAWNLLYMRVLLEHIQKQRAPYLISRKQFSTWAEREVLYCTHSIYKTRQLVCLRALPFFTIKPVCSHDYIQISWCAALIWIIWFSHSPASPNCSAWCDLWVY